MFTFIDLLSTYPAGIYQLKVNNRSSRTRCEICSKFTPCSTVCIVNFKLGRLLNQNDHGFGNQPSKTCKMFPKNIARDYIYWPNSTPK